MQSYCNILKTSNETLSRFSTLQLVNQMILSYDILVVYNSSHLLLTK